MRTANAALLIGAPLVLALGATAWLTFFDGAHTFDRKLSQEKRRAEIVGAAVAPKAPIDIVLVNVKGDLLTIERAEIDGGDLWLYYRNAGGSPVCNIRAGWSQLSPDGTVLKGWRGYVFIYSKNDASDILEAGERGEAHLAVPIDRRTTTLRLSVDSDTMICGN